MKSFIKLHILFLILLTTCIWNVEAQICKNISVHLDAQGTYTLSPYQLVSPDLSPEYDPVISQSTFTCDHLGINYINVYVRLDEDTIFTCIANVEILDYAPPSALCKSDLHVVFDSNGEHTFTFEELDNGSHNVCDNFYYKIIPPMIKCGDHIPLEVQLVLQDYSGYFDTCTILVTREEDPMPTVPIACPAKDTINVLAGPLYEDHPFPVTSDLILLGGPYGCPQNYYVQLSQGGNIRPLAILTNADTNQTFLARITDLETNEKCSTEIFVLGIPGCDITFNICDTLCHSAPLGDCDSGHTDLDGIEWPCDLVLTDVCPINLRLPTADQISWMQPDVALDAYPQVTSAFCEDLVFLGYYDKDLESPSPTSRRIMRQWTVLHWPLQKDWNYEQIIDIHFDITEICDTQPWDAPSGDCASGHTLTDDVEWPANITISTNYTHPDNLALNPEVDPHNVRPQVNTICNVATVDFMDQQEVINDSTILITRTWTIQDSYTEEEWSYVQQIQARKSQDGSLICISHEQGQPIRDVVLLPGITTDEYGCSTIPNPDGLIVTPTKVSPQEEAVNVLDLILMKEYILGQIALSPYSRLAGDFYNNYGLSALDLVRMTKLLHGTLESPIPKVWRFFEQVTNFPSIDISDPNKAYKFIGVKTGDIDNSYYLGSPDFENIFLQVEDEILNKGETYQIPVYLSQDINTEGFSVRIQNPNQNIEFISATAPDLPDFDFSLTVHPDTHEVSIIYVAPGLNLKDGLPISSDDPFFILEIKANENVILNEELILDIFFDNILKPGGNTPPLDFHFDWEDVILSSVASLGQGRELTIYPNPVRDQVYVKGLKDNDEGIMRILDATGRLILTSALQPILDLSNLSDGLYYVTISMLDGKSAVVPLYKTQ
jgi:hypothetical protein